MPRGLFVISGKRGGGAKGWPYNISSAKTGI